MSKSSLKESEPEISSRPDSVPVIKDPELLKEWESLTDPEDRADFLEALAALEEVERDGADFLEALAALEEVERDGTVSWEELKAEFGF
jgi:hypothetical protein